MAGPWEKYQQKDMVAAALAEPPAEGPWARYAAAVPAPADEAGRLRDEGGKEPSLEIDIVGGIPESQAQTAQPQQGGGLMRDLGMSARSVIQGAGSLIGAIGGDAFNYYLVPGDQPTYREAASALADRLGLPKPETAGERVLGDVGEALTGTGLTLGVGGLLNAGRSAVSAAAPTARNRLAELLTAQPGLQTVSTATGAAAAGTAREAGAGEGTQAAAGLLGGLAPGTGTAGAGATLRGIVRGRSGEQMQRTIEDFARLGATPSVGQASGNWAMQGIENLLAGGPTSAGVMSRFAERQADDISAGLRRMADGLSPNASGERAGRAIERGIKTFTGNTNAMKRALYWNADRYIPGETPVALPNTWQTVVELTTPNPGAKATTAALVNPKIQQLRQTLEQDVAAGGGQISYEALKRIRTDIGEAISDYSLSPDTPARELRRIYRALSTDMERAAQAAGPEAAAAAQRANNYTRAVADRLELVERIVDKHGGPERIFNAVMQGTRDGGTTLRAVMQSLPRDGQKAVTAAVIKRMGMPTPGQAGMNASEEFSAATFLTNWNRVSPEARRALFDRYGAGFSAAMDRIARVAENIKQGSKVFQNPSGTTNRGAAIGYGTALGGSIAQAPITGHYWPVVATVMGGIGGNLAARALTNPRIVNWLAMTTKMPVGSINASLREFAAQAEKAGDEDAVEFALALADENPEGTPRQSP